jgi:tetratricopeptide (TPR) repeat protein
MRTPSTLLLPPLLAFLFFVHPPPSDAQSPEDSRSAPAPASGELVSEDLLDTPEETTRDAQDPAATAAGAGAPAADPLAVREREAEQAFTDGDLARALELYRELAAQHPEAAERSRLRVTAAWLLFQLGNPDAASLELTATLTRDPAFQPRAEIYSPEFMALFLNAQRDAMQERERSAARLLKQGIDSLNAGDPVSARRRIEESLALAPGALRAIFALAQVDLQEGKTGAALSGFERVLALERGAPERLPRELKAQALNNVGVIYFGRGQYEDSTHALEEAASLNARDSRVWFNLGLARQKQGLAGGGLEALRTAHELDRRDAEIASELGRAYIAAQRWMDAVAVLLEATQLHPDSASLWLEFASAQRGLGNLQGMTSSLGKAIELDPANTQGAGFQAAMELAQAALTARNFGQALEAAGVAVQMRPGDGSAWALLGLSQQASGRLPEAAESLEKAAAVAPDRADIAHNLGTVYLAQRRYPEAEASFRRAVSLDPGATEAAAALTRLEAQRTQSTSSRDGAKRNARSEPARTTSAPSSARPAPAPAKRPELGARLVAVDYPPLGIRGLLVEAVTPGGLAELSGLLVDDLVLRAFGRPVTQPSGLLSLLDSSRSTSVQLSVLRAGKPVEVVLRMP